MQEKRRLDRRHHLGRDLQAVVRHRGREIGTSRRHPVDHAAAEAEADRADLAGRFRMLLHERDGRERCRDHVLALGLGVKLARLVLFRRRTAVDGQKVGREHEVAFDRESARHVFDMWVEPAVLVDDDDGGALAQGLAAHEIAVDLALGGIVGHAFGGEPRVVRSHDRGLRVIIL